MYFCYGFICQFMYLYQLIHLNRQFKVIFCYFFINNTSAEIDKYDT